LKHALIRAMKIAELLQSLTDARVDYVLVGGLAVQLHGYMRSTFDIDLVLAMKRAANRSKDRMDIEALEKIKRGEDPNV
jgi:hypothetical protein